MRTMNKDDGLEIQESIISILLKHKDAVQDFVDKGITVDYFDKDFRIFIHAIVHAHENGGVLLTRNAFIAFVSEILQTKQQIAVHERMFFRLSCIPAQRGDFHMLLIKLKNDYLSKTSSRYIRKFADLQKERGSRVAIEELAHDMNDLVGDLQPGKQIIYADINNFNQEYWKEFEETRQGKKPPKRFVSFGFEELDKTSQVGLDAGTLTLFCGDVGGYKSTMMLNIAMNAWLKDGKNVLFVPLEMPRVHIQNKMIARHTHIPFDVVTDPRKATDEQAQKIHDALFKDWVSNDGKMFIMDSFEKRVQVSMLRREIDRNIDIFKPDAVIIDYIANLEPDKQRHGRNDLEIGDMLKDLRHMGRPGVSHEGGFAVVSGAQIGRDALKRVRRGTGEKVMFYSEDLRGSHEYSADSDNIYVLFKDPQDPERLQLYAVKCRYGKTTFPDGNSKAILTVRPSVGLILSSSDYYASDNEVNVLKKSDDMDLDHDFSFVQSDGGEEELESDVDFDDLFE